MWDVMQLIVPGTYTEVTYTKCIDNFTDAAHKEWRSRNSRVLISPSHGGRSIPTAPVLALLA